MFIYIDTSALISFYFEDKSPLLKRIPKTSRLLSSTILEVEFASFIIRNKLNIHLLKEVLKNIQLVTPPQSFSEEILKVSEIGYLRGADMFHICTALFLDKKKTNLRFLTCDNDQKNIAKKLGFHCL